jgi:hypothetical protein
LHVYDGKFARDKVAYTDVILLINGATYEK